MGRWYTNSKGGSYILIDEYLKARKAAEREYKIRTAAGEYPFLPALDDILPDCDKMAQKPLGIMEIPTVMIAGTKTRARQNAFAANFMPILEPDSEFASKWCSLYSAQVSEGINDPIKVYEYLRRFYVIEGNKRVSVFRFLEMPVISAEVIRINPTGGDLEENPSYAGFLRFFEATGIYDIECSRAETYGDIAVLLGEDLEHKWSEDSVRSLKSAYWGFTEAYAAGAGRGTNLPAGDAFAIYLKVYIKDAMTSRSLRAVEKRISRIKKELTSEQSDGSAALIEEADEALNAGSIITRTGSTISRVIPALTYNPKHPLKAAFIYDTGISGSSWTADHEKGRLRLEHTYGGTVATRCYEGCADRDAFERAVKDASEWGADAVFTTSPGQIDDALRAAIEYEKIKFLNCSVNLNRQAVRTYYAKIYEAKFLAGLAAGIYSAADGTHSIGYCSDYPIYGTIAGINAFAIGAAMTDPSVRIYLDWNSKENSNWWWNTLGRGIHVMSAVDSKHNSDGSDAYGLCYVEGCEPGQGNDLSGLCRITNLAAPIWKWGKLYEIIIKTMIEGTYNSKEVDKKDRATNYWWGMISGVVDIELSDALSPYTRQLVNALRRDIINGSFNPFDGELRSQDGLIKSEDGKELSSRDIIQMDWLCENIIGEIPSINSLKEGARKTVKVSGVGRSRE